MERNALKLFVYKEGEHFEIPESVLAVRGPGARQRIPLLERVGENGDCLDGKFVRANSPDEADFIVFPYVLEPLLGVERAFFAHFYLRSLPHYYDHEPKHVFFHFQDRGHPLLTDALVITDDPDRNNPTDRRLATFPHFPKPHVLAKAPDFDYDRIRYDVSFVGALSWPVRTVLAKAMAQEKRLRYFLHHPDNERWWDKKTSYLHMDDGAEKRRLESIYVNTLRRSWAGLCPRGMGSSSIRFYEVMCMGRIPVHVSDAYILPFADRIDYASFCLSLPESEAHNAGRLLYHMLRKKSREELEAMCRRARQVWEENFQAAMAKDIALEILDRNRPDPAMPPLRKNWFVEHELLDEDEPRRCWPESFYGHLPIDHGRIWIFKGMQAESSPEDPVMLCINGVSGYLAPQDVQYLMRMAARVRSNGTIVEIGSWMGLSSIVMANALLLQRNLSARIYCVDTWRGSQEHQDMAVVKEDRLYRKFLDNIRGAAVEQLISPIRADSPEAAVRFRDHSVDLLFVDGDHTHEGCLVDLEAWWGKVRPGGTVIGHDYYPDNGVASAVDAFVAAHDVEFLVEPSLRIFRIEKPLQEAAGRGCAAVRPDLAGSGREARATP
ncbi:MAG: class I SAM-dependent methyltransferase [Thermodesulfobacteriota bacterium]